MTSDKLRKYADEIQCPKLHSIAAEVLADDRFRDGFGGHKHHHCYKGGLPVHTLEVVKQAVGMAMNNPQASLDVLITAAIVHDYHKIHDYEWAENDSEAAGEIKGTPYRDRVNHVAGSFAWFIGRAAHYQVDQITTDAISHCLLAHHGRREWGSPVEPQTIEAHILHYADMLSSRFGDGKVEG